MNGLIVINKPPGISSFRALSPIKRMLPKKTKVGHTGTLDPFAEGVLVCLVGGFTKLASAALGHEKKYLVTVSLGKQTDTLDPTGITVKEGPVPSEDDLLVMLDQILPKYHGSICQTPPAYSAIHINGKRAYQLARDGKDFSIPSRDVIIHQIDCRGIESGEIKLFVHCSSGTYIRSIARDIALDLGTCGYASQLKRLDAGGFSLEEAVSLDSTEDIDLSALLRSDPDVYRRLTGNGIVEIASSSIYDFLHGKKISADWFLHQGPDNLSGNQGSSSIFGVYADSGKFIGQVSLVEGCGLKYDFVIPNNSTG
ncbi:MAG: tRNA pseudouridine(55) synthase TruB [Spirochaetaceae bacterium]|nr:MAG: tRNA pseudouridine(55) synthase TruB [Spirochaetaceae bacterium]